MIPTFQEFNPNLVPWQMRAIDYWDDFDYSKGVLEIMFSGSIGSAKSVLGTHLIVLHCIENAGAKVLVQRRTLKELKRTIWETILSHIQDIPHLIKNYNKSAMKIEFINGSEIFADSYDNGDTQKYRSLTLSAAVYEEGSESNKEVYDAVKMRVGRLPHITKNFILIMTNPDEPDHYLHKLIIESDGENNKKVFYSLTEDNPFLPKWYIRNLKADLDPQMALRMLKGQWISIRRKNPYYAYDQTKQFINSSYVIDTKLPLDFMHDFNIGEGKPMSAAIGQVVNGVFHIAKDFIVEGFNTEQIVDEMIDSGYLEKTNKVRVWGDCNGRNRDTRGNRSDYDIIKNKLQKFRKQNGMAIEVEMCVPKSNPPVRSRQNKVNASCINDNGEIRLYIYKDAKTVDEGLRLTKVKKGSGYQEDDSDYFQHVTTALGYYIYAYRRKEEKWAMAEKVRIKLR